MLLGLALVLVALTSCSYLSATPSSETRPQESVAMHTAEEPGKSGSLEPLAGEQVRSTLAEAVEALPGAPEVREGYERDLFSHWSDVDGNGCDTRAEVLISQNRSASAGLTRSCDVLDGEWLSYYDQVTTHHASDVEIDHLVPLAEAWDSGASTWSSHRREAFANDLGDRRSLVAVSSASNQSKSDGDPADWMPAFKTCVYISSWVAVKTRWQLSVDDRERDALREYASACGDRRTTVVIAQPTGDGSTRDARPSDAASLPAADEAPPPGSPAPAENTVAGESEGPADSAGIDPRFDYCTGVLDAGLGPYERGTDREYAWYTDGDGDGIVCES
ncbi:DUF1524 domain-containing protein [Nocardioides sp. W7]|uniref:GmrSD restriction endonuclease domain-containing protein n=1 Tax=Nocardioides sp. W7 TaxID=2931390 RepID=UPI001FD32194|nr:DUF1524 domain-containing protein [Nocardioides sp. W7]